MVWAEFVITSIDSFPTSKYSEGRGGHSAEGAWGEHCSIQQIMGNKSVDTWITSYVALRCDVTDVNRLPVHQLLLGIKVVHAIINLFYDSHTFHYMYTVHVYPRLP